METQRGPRARLQQSIWCSHWCPPRRLWVRGWSSPAPGEVRRHCVSTFPNQAPTRPLSPLPLQACLPKPRTTTSPKKSWWTPPSRMTTSSTVTTTTPKLSTPTMAWALPFVNTPPEGAQDSPSATPLTLPRPLPRPSPPPRPPPPRAPPPRSRWRWPRRTCSLARSARPLPTRSSLLLLLRPRSRLRVSR